MGMAYGRIFFAMKFFEGFPKVKDYTSSRIFFLIASHAWLHLQFEAIS